MDKIFLTIILALLLYTPITAAEVHQYLPLTVGSWWEHSSRLGDIRINVLETDDPNIVKYICDTSFGISYVLMFESKNNQVSCNIRDIKVLFFKSTLIYSPSYVMFDFPLTENKLWSWAGNKVENNKPIESELEGEVLGIEKIRFKDEFLDCKIIKLKTTDIKGNNENITLWLAPDIGIVKGQIELEGIGLLGLLANIIGNKINIDLQDYEVIPN